MQNMGTSAASLLVFRVITREKRPRNKLDRARRGGFSRPFLLGLSIIGRLKPPLHRWCYHPEMPNFTRSVSPGGTFFFTLVTENRARLFDEEQARTILGNAIRVARGKRPFELDSIVLLPDHLHLILTLPSRDADFSTRLASIKAAFTHEFLASGGIEQPRSESRVSERRRGVWQRWFWEHLIRDENDLHRHRDYIHYNPVKHGLTQCPHDWTFSSFDRHAHAMHYEQDWCCSCKGQNPQIPDFSWAEGCEGE